MVNKAQSWLVHVFTASGAFAGFLSLEAVISENIMLAFIWLSIAFFIDGIDGTLARKVNVKESIPVIDGSIIDNVVDYLNYVFIPALIIYSFNLIPQNLGLLTCFIILTVSCYTFANINLKTKDNFFVGFPALWNILVFYLFILELSQTANFLIIIFFSVLTFIPIKFVHPLRIERKKMLTIFMLILWGIICCLLLIEMGHQEFSFFQYKDTYFWIWIALTFYFIYLSINRTFEK